MKAALKITLWLIAGAGAFFAVVAGLSSASEWMLLHNYQGYKKSDFVISGTRMGPSTGDEGSNYYLQGAAGDDEFEFAIDASDYERFSQPDFKGTVVQIYRNSEMASIAFQKRSLNVIFAEEWRDLSELEISARSTRWLSIISFLLSVAFYLTARLALPPLLNQNAEQDVTPNACPASSSSHHDRSNLNPVFHPRPRSGVGGLDVR